MAKKKDLKIFTENELYELANADNSAMEFAVEAGTSADWSEYVGDDSEAFHKFMEFTDDEQTEFEDRLREAVVEVKDDFKELSELNEDDFDMELEFTHERREIIQGIKDSVSISLSEYCVDIA